MLHVMKLVNACNVLQAHLAFLHALILDLFTTIPKENACQLVLNLIPSSLQTVLEASVFTAQTPNVPNVKLHHQLIHLLFARNVR